MKKEFVTIREDIFSKFNTNITNLNYFCDTPAEEIKGVKIFLPISIFGDSGLSALEAITKYMKEDLDLRYRDIAFFLNRDERTIWGSYHSSKRKMQSRFAIENAAFFIPSSLFKDRSLGVLEAIAEYLRDELQFRYCQIASLLNRDDRTIWTVYHRAKKKRRAMRANGISP